MVVALDCVCMPKAPTRVELTSEQIAAYVKLRDGIGAVLALEAADTASLQSWLRNRLTGPIDEPVVLLDAADGVLTVVREYDEQDATESHTSWGETVVALAARKS